MPQNAFLSLYCSTFCHVDCFIPLRRILEEPLSTDSKFRDPQNRSASYRGQQLTVFWRDDIIKSAYQSWEIILHHLPDNIFIDI